MAVESPRYIIYGLVDPRSQELRYVGKTVKGAKHRLSDHICRARAGVNSHVYCWVRQILELRLKPEVVVLESHQIPDTLYDAEQWYIAYFRSIGCVLTNATDGGPGTLGRKWTPAMRQRLTDAAKRENLSVETLKRMSDSHKGCSPSIDARIRSSRNRGIGPFRDQNGIVYQTINEAARMLGIRNSGISKVLCGKYQQTEGHQFAYLDQEFCVRRPKPAVTDQTRLKMSRSRGGRLLQDQNGIVYQTIHEAADKLGLNSGNVSSVLGGKNGRKTTGGYTFSYVE